MVLNQDFLDLRIQQPNRKVTALHLGAYLSGTEG